MFFIIISDFFEGSFQLKRSESRSKSQDSGVGSRSLFFSLPRGFNVVADGSKKNSGSQSSLAEAARLENSLSAN